MSNSYHLWFNWILNSKDSDSSEKGRPHDAEKILIIVTNDLIELKIQIQFKKLDFSGEKKFWLRLESNAGLRAWQSAALTTRPPGPDFSKINFNSYKVEGYSSETISDRIMMVSDLEATSCN